MQTENDDEHNTLQMMARVERKIYNPTFEYILNNFCNSYSGNTTERVDRVSRWVHYSAYKKGLLQKALPSIDFPNGETPDSLYEFLQNIKSKTNFKYLRFVFPKIASERCRFDPIEEDCPDSGVQLPNFLERVFFDIYSIVRNTDLVTKVDDYFSTCIDIKGNLIEIEMIFTFRPSFLQFVPSSHKFSVGAKAISIKSPIPLISISRLESNHSSMQQLTAENEFGRYDISLNNDKTTISIEKLDDHYSPTEMEALAGRINFLIVPMSLNEQLRLEFNLSGVAISPSNLIPLWAELKNERFDRYKEKKDIWDRHVQETMGVVNPRLRSMATVPFEIWRDTSGWCKK